MPPIDTLLARLSDIHNLEQAGAVLNWDQRTYMPPKGSEPRAKQLATLAKLSHEMFVDRQTQDLLAAAEAETYPEDSDHKAMLRVVRRGIDKATRVPTELIVALTQTASLAEDAWQGARANSNYADFAPWLEKLLGLKRQYAAAVFPNKPIYDALLDDFEEAMTTADLDPLFADLKKHTIPLVAAIKQNAHKVRSDILNRDYDPAAQQAFSTFILKQCGFPFDRGRLDPTVHPFCTNFSQNDVRITTRYEKNWLPGALFGCLHEMGHAFYELNVHPNYEATPLAGGVSLGIHESQSRLWENLVGRSREFWTRYYPDLQRYFPGQLADVSLEDFYRAINRVVPSLIRVEADEVTYNLHIILRYEMEQELLSQRLSVKDAPAAWNAKMHSYLGITPPTDREGILQDVHWAFGGYGYFPTYTLGNVIASQLFATAQKALPTLSADVIEGKFSGLYQWLQTNIHQYGKKYLPTDLLRRATGASLTTKPYLDYLKGKFSTIYGL